MQCDRSIYVCRIAFSLCLNICTKKLAINLQSVPWSYITVFSWSTYDHLSKLMPTNAKSGVIVNLIIFLYNVRWSAMLQTCSKVTERSVRSWIIADSWHGKHLWYGSLHSCSNVTVQTSRRSVSTSYCCKCRINWAGNSAAVEHRIMMKKN